MFGIYQKPKSMAAILLSATLMLSACQTVDKQTIGSIGGAVIGGLLGAHVGKGTGQLIAVGAGAVLGGILGSTLGKSLEEADRRKMEESTQTALENEPDYSTSSWVNPETGASGTITPQESYQQEDGQYCREFTQTVMIGGQEEEAYGTACRQPDGAWKIVS